MEDKTLIGGIAEQAIALGALRAEVIDARLVKTNAEFRKMCEKNLCGRYGKCWMCPPDIGDIDEMMASLSPYRYVLVYQTVGALEDSFDIEGMQEAGDRHNRLASAVRAWFRASYPEQVLCLGAGGCRVCPQCAKESGEPCRYPDEAMTSLEAYGIHVSELARTAGMKYINGQNTVTYFGAVFFSLCEA